MNLAIMPVTSGDPEGNAACLMPAQAFGYLKSVVRESSATVLRDAVK
jgi:hypothetical protein